MELAELEFKAEDRQIDMKYHMLYGMMDGPKTYDVSELVPMISIERANELLRERLAKAPKVDGYIHADGYILMDKAGSGEPPHNGESIAYSGRLVCLEKIDA